MIDFIEFLKHPTLGHVRKPDWIEMLKLFLMYLFIAVPLGGIVLFVSKTFNIEHADYLTFSVKTILIAVFIAPVYEEILFRGLLRLSGVTALLFVVTGLCLLTVSFINGKTMSVIVLTIILLGFAVLFFKVGLSRLQMLADKNFRSLYYISSALFGLLHVFNFSGDVIMIAVFSVILILPQLVLGLILGFVRTRYGLKSSIVFHMIVNFPVMLALLK